MTQVLDATAGGRHIWHGDMKDAALVPPGGVEAGQVTLDAAGRTWGEQIVRPDDDATMYATVSGFDADGEHNLRAILRDVLGELQR